MNCIPGWTNTRKTAFHCRSGCGVYFISMNQCLKQITSLADWVVITALLYTVRLSGISNRKIHCTHTAKTHWDNYSQVMAACCSIAAAMHADKGGTPLPEFSSLVPIHRAQASCRPVTKLKTNVAWSGPSTILSMLIPWLGSNRLTLGGSFSGKKKMNTNKTHSNKPYTKQVRKQQSQETAGWWVCQPRMNA